MCARGKMSETRARSGKKERKRKEKITNQKKPVARLSGLTRPLSPPTTLPSLASPSFSKTLESNRSPLSL
ncbi:hypothetical protein AKJ16_DCAP09535 [Drosera capensis]